MLSCVNIVGFALGGVFVSTMFENQTRGFCVLLEKVLWVDEGEVPFPNKGDERFSREEGAEGNGGFSAFSCFDLGLLHLRRCFAV